MKLPADKLSALHSEALRQLKKCRLCPRECGVNRLKGEKGFCGVGGVGIIFREMINNYEEQCLNPSHQVYFAGCNLRCGYCSVEQWNMKIPEKGLPVYKIAAAVNEKRMRSKSLNILGGDPAVSIAAVFELLSLIEDPNPVVWNSNMYYSPVVTELTATFTDIYLADMKCWNSGCCHDVLGAGDYRETAMARIKEAAARRRVIVRHLIMPGHIDCCLEPITRWLKDELPQVEFSPRYNFISFKERANCPQGYLSKEEISLSKAIIEEKLMNIIT